MRTLTDGSALQRAVMISGLPLRGKRTTHRTLLPGLVGWPARNGSANMNAAAELRDASAYGTLNPGLESDHAAAVQVGGAPV
jgi:Arc/MetJ family transcription regulator